MSVPQNGCNYLKLRKPPKYKRRANKLAKKQGFESALHMFLFRQILAQNIAKRKEAQVNA